MWLRRLIKGRQGTGYAKLKLLRSERLKMDAYILKYPEGSHIPPHTDPVDSNKHYRLNVVLEKSRGDECVGSTFSGAGLSDKVERSAMLLDIQAV